MPWDEFASKRPIPCKDCPDRYLACSDHCQKPVYLAWKAEREKIKQARRDYKAPAWVRRECLNRRHK
jgi:hypothetical protein